MFDDHFTIAYIGNSGQYWSYISILERITNAIVCLEKSMSILFDLMILFGGSLLSCDTQPTCKVANWALFQRDFHHSKLEGPILLGHYHIFTYFSYLLYMFIPYLSICYLTLSYFCSTDVVHTFLKWMKGWQERTVCWDSWAAGSSQANLMDFFMYPSADSETVVVSVVGLESQEPLLWTSLIIDLSDSSRRLP